MSENKYDMFRAAMREAKDTMRAADNVADGMAEILEGRLRKVSPYYLKKLKRELSMFNVGTGKWREGA